MIKVMNILFGSRMSLRLVTVLMLSIFANGALAQANQTLVGSVEALAQDDGYIRISGSNYSFDDEVTVVFLRGEQVQPNTLNEGMAVRFTVNARGQLQRIDILGPFNQTRLLEEN